MEEYRSNAHKAREINNEPIPEKKIEKIVRGNVVAKKKGTIQKLAELIIPEDVENVKSYILEDVIAPTIKDAILDVVKAVLGMSGRGSDRMARRASKVSYRSYYEDDRRPYERPKAKTGYEYDDILLDDRKDAEEVLARMDELIDTYGIVSVADLYDLVGITGSYTDNKYGWTDIRSAAVVRAGDGYMIKLPKAMPFN